jgi:hypothetical protein
MESIEKLGEVQMEMTSDVKTSEELKVLLRWGWGAETTGKLVFKPSEELKVGDGIKVTVEKVVIVPDPVEEKTEETATETEAAEETAVEAECACCDATEPVATETAAKIPAETAEETAGNVDDTKTA